MSEALPTPAVTESVGGEVADSAPAHKRPIPRRKP